MVADALQRLDAQRCVDHPTDVARVFHQVSRQTADRALEQFFEVFGVERHLGGDAHVFVSQRLQTVVQQDHSRLGHAADVFEDRALAHVRLIFVQALGDVGHTHRFTADALQVVNGTRQSQHETQIAGDRLVDGEQLGIGFERLDIEVAHQTMIVDHLARLADIAGAQRFAGENDLIANLGAHIQHQAAKISQIAVESRQDVRVGGFDAILHLVCFG